MGIQRSIFDRYNILAGLISFLFLSPFLSPSIYLQGYHSVSLFPIVFFHSMYNLSLLLSFLCIVSSEQCIGICIVGCVEYQDTTSSDFCFLPSLVKGFLTTSYRHHLQRKWQALDTCWLFWTPAKIHRVTVCPGISFPLFFKITWLETFRMISTIHPWTDLCILSPTLLGLW